jgi:hypothetical protein
MPETIIIPYSRFLEIRQRRRRMLAELTQQVTATPGGVPLRSQPVTIDCEAVGDEHREAESPLTTSGAKDCVGPITRRPLPGRVFD